MNDDQHPLEAPEAVSNPGQGLVRHEGGRVQSLAHYWFDPNDLTWSLDKDTTVTLNTVHDYLSGGILAGCIATLTHFAQTLSASYTYNLAARLSLMLSRMGASEINASVLINYRATLDSEHEYFIGMLGAFFRKWHALGHPGVDEDVLDLLDGWRLKGNIKGDAVKRLDPNEGPLTDNELLAFNEGAVRAFELNRISLADLAISLLLSHSGRRGKQITHIKNCDLDGTKTNNKGEPLCLIHIPRGKQKAATFRQSFKTFAMTRPLWTVLGAQRKNSIASVERVLGYELQDGDRADLPLFPDLHKFRTGQSVIELRKLLATDYLHIPTAEVQATIRKVVQVAEIVSERTGALLNVFPRRFRYTKGTRAAREGFGVMVIAELLDHTDTQNAGVYVANLPEHAKALDEKMAMQLAPFAKAFQGVIVDTEADAKRGNDPASRIKFKGEDAANCGQNGYCGGKVPLVCYTCMHFQPWLDGPHREVLAFLLEDRERVLQLTGDETMAAVNDRTILAVADVIRRCEARKKEGGA